MALLDHVVVVTVDYFTHQPRFRETRPNGVDNVAPKIARHRVGGIQTPGVDAAFKPVGHDVGGVCVPVHRRD